MTIPAPRDPVTTFATDVVEGRVVASRKNVQACQRHLNDLRDAEAKATEDPEQGVDGLQAALAKADADADVVARDPAASDARLSASCDWSARLEATTSAT